MSNSAQPTYPWTAADIDELARIRETVDAKTSERMLAEFRDWYEATSGDLDRVRFRFWAWLACVISHHDWAPMRPDGSPRSCQKCGLTPGLRRK